MTLPVLPVKGWQELHGALARLVRVLGSVPPRFPSGGRRAHMREDVPQFASEGFGMIIGMRMIVHRHDGTPIDGSKTHGPEAGRVFSFWTRAGVPVAWWEHEEQATTMPREQEEHGRAYAEPGMVVVHLRTFELYAIDVDGDAVPLGMRIPRDYSNGSRMGPELATVGTTDE